MKMTLKSSICRIAIGFLPILAGMFFQDAAQANVYLVTNTSDTGAGSLRQAITSANSNPGPDTIQFQISGSGPFTITLASILPFVVDSVTIDGTTQSGYGTNPLVELNGASAGNAAGLQLNPGSDGSTIMGLAINRFSAQGIVINSSNNVIRGNYIGTDTTGTIARGNSSYGILVNSAGNVIGGTAVGARNVVSGNLQSGVYLNGSGATGNLIQGNFIGIDVSGVVALSNSGEGIILNNAPGNTIGGGNVISGNLLDGVYLTGVNATTNAVVGNYIGTDVTGKVAVGNHYYGIYFNNSSANSVGGAAVGAGNLISGNILSGIAFAANSNTNLVQANIIGLCAGGTNRLPNQQDGILINGGNGNTIGGAIASVRNIISGNGINGLVIGLTNDAYNVIAGNYIGTDVTGKKSFGNNVSGISVLGSTNLIGGTKVGNGNVVSGNGLQGILLLGTNGINANNLVAGNIVGLDATGTNILGNGNVGIAIQNGAGNQIGGVAAGQRNIISGNATNGIALYGSSTSNNIIQGNYIGTDINGVLSCSNNLQGIYAESVAANTIGGLVGGAANLISGNGVAGVVLNNSTGVLIQGNYLGLNAAGTGAIKNTAEGVVIISSFGTNWIGGTNAAARNVISGNGTYGVHVIASSGQVIQGNYIGTDVSGSNAIANFAEGVYFENSSNSLVGGIGGGNLISGNGSSAFPAVLIFNSSQNTVQGNIVGLNVSGTTALANGGTGIKLWNAIGNNVGGSVAGAGNIVSGNILQGIFLTNASQNTVRGNLIGVNMLGTAAIGNGQYGISMGNSFSNIIGGTISGAGNVISGNGYDGIYFINSSKNLIQGNLIGLAADGVSPMGNTTHNVEFDVNSTNNILGGSAPGAGNSIAYAKTITPTSYAGVRVRNLAINNQISGNSIFNNNALGIDLGNQGVNANVDCESGVSATAANLLQNYPILSNSVSSSLGTLIRGSFDSAAGKVYSIEFFASTNGDATGYGEGQLFLGQTNLTLGTACSTNFSVLMPFNIRPGWVLTATATDANNNTSEFSNWITNLPAPPLASLATYNRTANLALRIAITNLMTNWSDTNGLPVSLTAINLHSTNQVVLQTNSGYIYYPSNAPNVNDQITYTISDGYSTNIGLVNIVIVPSTTGQVQGISVSNGVARVKFAGLPGWAYNVQRSTNLSSLTWVTLLTTNAPVGGLFQFTDTFSDLGGIVPVSAYYQLLWHP